MHCPFSSAPSRRSRKGFLLSSPTTKVDKSPVSVRGAMCQEQVKGLSVACGARDNVDLGIGGVR